MTSTKHMSEDKKKRIKAFISIIKLLILVIIIIGIPTLIYFMFPDFIKQFKSMESVNEFLSQYETASIFIYIGLQIFQIVVSVIPGQILQFSAGYAYTFWFGYFYSMIGITIGTIVTFKLARILGTDAMHTIFGEERISKFVNMLNSKKAYVIIFILYLIPGFPKDLITYAAGVSCIKLRPFLIIALVGRTPSLMATIMMGSMFRNGSYFGLIILSIIVAILFILAFLKRHELMKFADKAYDVLLGNNKKNKRRK